MLKPVDRQSLHLKYLRCVVVVFPIAADLRPGLLTSANYSANKPSEMAKTETKSKQPAESSHGYEFMGPYADIVAVNE